MMAKDIYTPPRSKTIETNHKNVIIHTKTKNAGIKVFSWDLFKNTVFSKSMGNLIPQMTMYNHVEEYYTKYQH